jgi:hypothetical protein
MADIDPGFAEDSRHLLAKEVFVEVDVAMYPVRFDEGV